ncbi:hypothetical protein CEXT_546491 [Caerostris extrusa]|uniref:Uncharacterized protein n=1 Tax=Caerostris extrusa TaxID=172846 RepID=A0AAV4TP86_CAEEX|nr:hypothetical protein CEXT_546491 [Caerostris extrusa]
MNRIHPAGTTTWFNANQKFTQPDFKDILITRPSTFQSLDHCPCPKRRYEMHKTCWGSLSERVVYGDQGIKSGTV